MNLDKSDSSVGDVKEEKMEVEVEQAATEEKEKKVENEKPVIVLSGLDNTERKHQLPPLSSHLVMSKLSRTNNFLLCLPTVKHVLGLRWLQESQANNKFLSEESFALVDPEVETRFNFSLSRTLSRSSRDKLFSGKVFYLTPSVLPSMQVLSAIVEASGGR